MTIFPTHFYDFEVLRISLFLTECLLTITNKHLTIILDVTFVIYKKFHYIYMHIICVLNNVF
jgi:hypothetical protein